MKFIVSVGSSTAIGGSASSADGSHRVTPMLTWSMPATSTMSPASASSAAERSRPLKVSTWLTLPLPRFSSPYITTTSWFGRMVPRLMRPMPS